MLQYYLNCGDIYPAQQLQYRLLNSFVCQKISHFDVAILLEKRIVNRLIRQKKCRKWVVLFNKSTTNEAHSLDCVYQRSHGTHIHCCNSSNSEFQGNRSFATQVSQAHKSAALNGLYYYLHNCRREFFTWYTAISFHNFRSCATEGYKFSVQTHYH